MLSRALVLGERAPPAPAEDLVAGLRLRHVRADGLDGARHVDAAHAPLRPPETLADADEVRLAAQRVPVVRVDRCRADRDEDAVVVELRPVDLLEPQDARAGRTPALAITYTVSRA